MKSLRLKAFFVIGFAAIVLQANTVLAKDKWINLSTKNFNIISNADEGGSRKLALKLEQFHYVDFAAAKSSLEPLLGADVDPTVKTMAERTMQMIESGTGPSSAIAESARSLNIERNVDVENTSPSTSGPPRLARRPTLRIEGAQVIRGVLVSIECKAGEWTLVVNTRDDLLRFAVTNKGELEFSSQDPQFEGKVDCGPVNRIAYVYYKPISGKSQIAGYAVGIEFTKD